MCFILFLILTCKKFHLSKLQNKSIVDFLVRFSGAIVTTAITTAIAIICCFFQHFFYKLTTSFRSFAGHAVIYIRCKAATIIDKN